MTIQPSPELERLVEIGQLERLRPTQSEVEHLVSSGTARLNDASNDELSDESRFDLAYNASHSLALAALRHFGYRSKNRYVVFQALEHTVGLPTAKWRVLAKAHDKRNIMEYEGEGDIDRQLLSEMITLANEIELLVAKLVR